MSTRPRHIAHLDMDAFYASVELLRYPELRGQAVVIGAGSAHQPVLQADGSRRYARLRDYAGRGVVTTSTYEARALGVFSAMGLMKAAKLAPDAILLPTDFTAYRHYSKLFKAAASAIVPQMEDRGIDEIYLDLKDQNEEIAVVAQRIKDAVNLATGLSCSIGIAPNKLLAKICSDLEKPNGLTILSTEDIPLRIWPLSVKKINGIGPKSAEKLAGLGILTIAQLAACDPAVLQANFGRVYSAWLMRVAHGIDDKEVMTRSEPKSISRESTLERDLHAKLDRKELSVLFTQLCERVADDLVRKGYLGRTVGIKLRYADFSTVTRDLTLPDPSNNAQAIRQAAGECLRRVPLDKRLRLLGVRITSLSKPGEVLPTMVEQGELFAVEQL
ncbi:DNA polymerase IV [Herminiimonas fonticola]|uniref:DNA polymerase IV n=1 Tax=Herminiimonas fonticola TaxID=303380 RepID=UPI0033427F41